MARQSGSKAKLAAPRTQALRGAIAKGGGTLQQRLAAAERERDALRAELKRMTAHVRRLDETNAQVRDRISWALDSLQSILNTHKA
jgi:uncharacterized coiled-coil DUF342 family protein